MKSSCKITFTGLNINRLLNQFGSVGIALYSVVRQGKTCVIEVPRTRYKQVVALLKEKCYNIEKIEYTGSFAILRFAKSRYMLLVFMLLCVLAVAITSHFCQKIVITGDYDEGEVLASLAELGIDKGKSLYQLDVDALENALANRMDAMYAVVNRKGGALYVNVVKKKVIDPPIDIHSRRDIVATFSGRVKSLFCEQGLALVKEGDYVKEGDVLIEGSRVFNDGSREDAYALGQVTIEVTSTGFCEFNGVKTVCERTGNKQTLQRVVLFGKAYGKQCDYPLCDVEISSVKLYPLNLEIQTVTCYETRNVSVPSTIEECKDELTVKAEEAARQNCDFDVLNIVAEVKNNGVQVTLIGERIVK